MKILLLIMLLICPALSHADTINCKVIGIMDGDIIKCLTAQKEQLKIRLYQIDAPEKKQAFGQKSKQALSNLIFDKGVKIETHGKDKYRRLLGTVYIGIGYIGLCGGNTIFCTYYRDVNLRMIEQGMAWYYPFTKQNPYYQGAQAKAKGNKIGLWSQKAIAPWEFRRKHN